MFCIYTYRAPSRTFLVLLVVLSLGLVLPARTARAQTFLVTETADSGTGSLREAIEAANDNPNDTPLVDTIAFNIDGPGPHTITLDDNLPEISDPVVIDGLTEPGASCASWPPKLQIEITGQGHDAFTITSSKNTIRGLVLNNLSRSIVLRSAVDDEGNTISDADKNVIQCNFIGTNVNGTAGRGNEYGIEINDQSDNLIGGTVATTRNLIVGSEDDDPDDEFDEEDSGVGDGIWIHGELARRNRIEGNYIGTNATGTAKLVDGAGSGVLIEGADETIVGGVVPGARNVIAGYTEFGVEISTDPNEETSSVIDTRVQGNLIGTNVDGTADLNNGSTGVRITNGSNSLIGGPIAGARNVIAGHSNAGILISGNISTGNAVQGNYIGTNAAGTAAIGNAFAGVFIFDAPRNTIGGSTAGAGNLISGNGTGVRIFAGGARQTSVQGNLIGTNAAGSGDLGNTRSGLYITTAGNTIGGTTAQTRNVISGNDEHGIELTGSGASGNNVTGNYIGTAVNGIDAIGNARQGILITESANQNNIGGVGAAATNTIANNGENGVYVSRGTGNAVRRNKIVANGGLGVELGDTGPTPNDPGDGDGGANLLINTPSLSFSRGAETRIVATLESTANTTMVIDLYTNGSCDASGYGEGETWLGSQTVQTNANGAANASFSLPNGPPERTYTATATDENGNTSEFARCTAQVYVFTLPFVTQ